MPDSSTMLTRRDGTWVHACIWAVLLLRTDAVDGQVVRVSSGQLRGARMQGQGGCRDYWEFRGVRYAAAPVGELRFKAPRPAAPWKGVVNATAEGSGCPQVSQGKVTGSEDCLNLDVYTPTLKCSGRSYPVIVWFHGGNLITGGVSRKEYGPDFLVHHDVVLVEPNYRLGALGFLNLDTSSVPGNAGIKDGLAALRWVRDNVAAFCGDPARVTLMGQSAGAKLVGFMALSKGGQGLFRAAIQMSGTANSPLAYTEDHVQRAHDLAARLGNTGTDAASVERTLLRADWRDLTRRTFEMNDNSGWGLPYNPFVASPERRPADGEEVALNRDPESLLSDPAVPRVPTLAGVVSGEGVAFTYGVLHDERAMAALVANMTQWLRSDIAYVGAATAKKYGVATSPNKSLLTEIARRVNDEFFVGHNPSTAYPEGLAQVVGDMRYVYPLYRWVRHLDHQKAPFYLYLFDVVSDFNYKLPDNPVTGTLHADDLKYVFHMKSVRNQELDGAGRANVTLREHVQLITDFAKTLTAPLIKNNDVATAASRRQHPLYLYIGKDVVETRSGNTFGAQKRMKFWDGVMELLLDPRRSPNSPRH